MAWMKNTNGKPDAVLTMTFIAFVVILCKVILADVEISLMSGFTMNFGRVDSGVVAAFLTPLLGAYVFRRHTDKKLGSVSEFNDLPPPDPDDVEDIDESGPVGDDN